MKSIELFAGAGGLGMGLHQAGFHPVKVVEWDRYCCDTIRKNKNRRVSSVSSWPLFENDIKSIDFSKFAGKIDLVSGGPPCQPFSLGGKHRAYDDTRDMFPEAIRTVRETQPKAFIFENVKGLTRLSFRNYFEYVRLQLEHPNITCGEGEDWFDHLKRLERHHTSGVRNDLHYNVVTRVVNAANYGVPQKRERVFFIGFRDDLGIEWSFPEETHSQDALIWNQINDPEYWDRHEIPTHLRIISPRARQRANLIQEMPQTHPWVTVRDAIRGLPNPQNEFFGQLSIFSDHKFQPGAKSYPGHTGSLMDEPAKTLKAGVHGVPGGENMLALPDGTVRYFTIRESARLQTFPDDYLFHGSWSETMRQLGNAVPVQLANLIGRNIANKLKATA
jgi:DNA (cytosine-5)-methyltransferase 1